MLSWYGYFLSQHSYWSFHGNYSWETVSLTPSHKATNKISYPIVWSGNAKKIILLADSYGLKLCNVCFICIISPSSIIPFPHHLCINGNRAQLFALPSGVVKHSVFTPLTGAQLCLSLAEPERESKLLSLAMTWVGLDVFAPTTLDIER